MTRDAFRLGCDNTLNLQPRGRVLAVNRLSRHVLVGLVAFLAPSLMALTPEAGWQLSFEIAQETFVLKEPVWSSLTLTNISGTPQPTTGFYGTFYLDGAPRACRPAHVWVPQGATPPSGTAAEAAGLPTLDPAGTTQRIWVDLSKACNIVGQDGSAVGLHTVCYRDEKNDSLQPQTVCVSFAIEAPEGIDKQAYEAFGHAPLADSERWGELLRRYPASTYAAYVVWSMYAKGIAGADTAALLDHVVATEPSGNSVPCDDPPRCDKNGWMSLSGNELLGWEGRWFGTILQNHPNIWLGDELRLKLALDRYLLGDKDGCEIGLEDLSEHGKPYVASKAGELLAAMRAKGMLEPKPPPAPRR